jgi:heat shock protein HtpX
MWAIAKRIVLFIAVNILVMLTLSIVMTIVTSVFGIQLAGMEQMIVMYSIIGFGGAFISLAMSRMMAKWMMGVKVIDPNTPHVTERRLLDMVYGAARNARLSTMPQVGVYESPEVNAFATGPTKSRSLVAVSTGLLERMDNDAVEGVIGHEVAHIANGDMVTMTLLQGVINTLVLIVARLVANLAAGQVEERSRGTVQFLVFMVMQVLLSILGSLVVAKFSRYREFRADAGGARLTSRERMLSGLKALRNVYGQVDDEHQSLATLKISGHTGSFLALFSTHPPLEERIRRLETMPL